MLILKTLVTGEMHGWGIANEIQRISRRCCALKRVLYPQASGRGLRKGQRATSDNIGARYYVDCAGPQAAREERTESALVGAIARVLEA
jgi:hypothetical protein